MAKLTKRTIDALKPNAKDVLVFDDEMPRFGVRIMRTGLKSFLIQYRAAGHTRRFTFGKYGLVTPDEARSQARQFLAAVDRGEDPSTAKKERRQAATVADLCHRFLTEYVQHRCKPTTQREYRRSVQLFIVPKIGQLKAEDVERRHLAQLHYEMRLKPYQANRTLGVLSKLFNLAEMWGVRPDGTNPCRHIKKYVEEKRERFLSNDDIARLGMVLNEVEQASAASAAAVAAFRLLLLTGCRLTEIQTLKWEYIQGSALVLPDSKTGAKTVPIGQPVLETLAGISRQLANPFVIVGRLPGSHLTDLERPWRRIRTQAGLSDVRIHDLRHTFASSAVALGETLPMIGKLLGHNQVQTTARYTHLAQDPLRSAADRISTEIAGALRARSGPPRPDTTSITPTALEFRNSLVANSADEIHGAKV